MNDLLMQGASQIVGRLKRREVSPLELVDAMMARIAAVDGVLNAVPTLCFERAREAAGRAENWSRQSQPRNFLYGIPILIKDNTAVAGVRTTYGSRIYKDNVPAVSDIAVQTLEANGAIVLGKTNTPEFSAGGNTYNDVFGTTYNPWRTDLTPGGSSGGSAAALASGQAWLASGNDLAGSVRLPASFCSVVGLRPSPGRIARGPSRFHHSTLSVEGCMARSVEDVALMLDAQVGENSLDPLSIPAPETSFSDEIRSFRACRIAFSPDLGITWVDPEVKSLCRQAISRFAEMGCSIAEAHPVLDDAEWIFESLRAFIYVERVAPLLEAHRDLISPNVVRNAERGIAQRPEELARAQIAHGNLYRRTVAFFDDYDLLACPTVITPPFDAKIRYLDSFLGKSFSSYSAWMLLTSAITLTGCPAISVPCGFTEAGLPVGLQIVGGPRQEARILAAAKALEDALSLGHAPIDPRIPNTNRLSA